MTGCYLNRGVLNRFWPGGPGLELGLSGSPHSGQNAPRQGRQEGSPHEPPAGSPLRTLGEPKKRNAFRGPSYDSEGVWNCLVRQRLCQRWAGGDVQASLASPTPWGDLQHPPPCGRCQGGAATYSGKRSLIRLHRAPCPRVPRVAASRGAKPGMDSSGAPAAVTRPGVSCSPGAPFLTTHTPRPGKSIRTRTPPPLGGPQVSCAGVAAAFIGLLYSANPTPRRDR